jgi:hypothetical protein
LTNLAKIVIGCTVVVLPIAAIAQSSDAKYCQALTETYRKAGAAGCEGERAVMDATASIYALSSRRPIPATALSTGTVGVYQVK